MDEAQDFPPAVFETIFYLTKHPKRIVWAYDEFQSLTEISMREPDDLFGRNAYGVPNVREADLEGEYSGGIAKDFVLKNSYRNPRRVLMFAHSLALGLYKENGPVDMLPDTQSWKALGYDVLQPEVDKTFQQGYLVEVTRSLKHSLNTLEVLLRTNRGEDAERALVSYLKFANDAAEEQFVVAEIARLVAEESIQPEDIVVVSLDFKGIRDQFARLRAALDRNGVKAITPGYMESANQFGKPGFVTLASPFRAKGNEANVVFVMSIIE